MNWLYFFILPVAFTGSLLYYGAIVAGVFKDPLMTSFRHYGEERRPYPFSRFLDMLAVWCFMLAFITGTFSSRSGYVNLAFAPLIFVVLGVMALIMDAIIRRRPEWREALPQWYGELLRTSSRQERRFIGYAWLRIPRRMRWHLNGDNVAFRSWADTVRITVIYGAYDPQSPWDMWV